MIVLKLQPVLWGQLQCWCGPLWKLICHPCIKCSCFCLLSMLKSADHKSWIMNHKSSWIGVWRAFNCFEWILRVHVIYFTWLINVWCRLFRCMYKMLSNLLFFVPLLLNSPVISLCLYLIIYDSMLFEWWNHGRWAEGILTFSGLCSSTWPRLA